MFAGWEEQKENQKSLHVAEGTSAALPVRATFQDGAQQNLQISTVTQNMSQL
jgi:hypothetical protein